MALRLLASSFNTPWTASFIISWPLTLLGSSVELPWSHPPGQHHSPRLMPPRQPSVRLKTIIVATPRLGADY